MGKLGEAVKKTISKLITKLGFHNHWIFRLPFELKSYFTLSFADKDLEEEYKIYNFTKVTKHWFRVCVGVILFLWCLYGIIDIVSYLSHESEPGRLYTVIIRFGVTPPVYLGVFLAIAFCTFAFCMLSVLYIWNKVRPTSEYILVMGCFVASRVRVSYAFCSTILAAVFYAVLDALAINKTVSDVIRSEILFATNILSGTVASANTELQNRYSFFLKRRLPPNVTKPKQARSRFLLRFRLPHDEMLYKETMVKDLRSWIVFIQLFLVILAQTIFWLVDYPSHPRIVILLVFIVVICPAAILCSVLMYFNRRQHHRYTHVMYDFILISFTVLLEIAIMLCIKVIPISTADMNIFFQWLVAFTGANLGIRFTEVLVLIPCMDIVYIIFMYIYSQPAYYGTDTYSLYILQTVLSSMVSLLACWYQEKLKRGIFYLTNENTAVNLATFTSSPSSSDPSLSNTYALAHSPSTIISSPSVESLQQLEISTESLAGLIKPEAKEDPQEKIHRENL